MTTEGTERARAAVQARLAELHWSRAQLARESTVDPNTIGDFLNGKRVPSDVTLSKLAQALGLTLGMLEDSGEDSDLLAEKEDFPPDMSAITDEQLLTELNYRVSKLKRELGRLQRQQAWRGTSFGDEEFSEDDTVTLTTREQVTRAARRAPSGGKQQAKDADDRGEGSQDNENWGSA